MPSNRPEARHAVTGTYHQMRIRLSRCASAASCPSRQLHHRPRLQAVLLIGFAQHEVDAFQALMISMNGDMIKVSEFCVTSLEISSRAC